MSLGEPGRYWTPRVHDYAATSEFRRTGHSRHFDINWGFYRKGRHEKEMEKAQVLKKWLGPRGDAVMPAAGWKDSPYGDPPMVNGETITSLHFAFAAALVLHWGRLPGSKTINIVEIGGGFGGFARVLIEHIPGVTLTLVDFPRMLQLQRQYLGLALADKRRESPMPFIHPAGELWPFERHEVDAVVNMTSMCEMDPEQAQFYVREAHRCLRPLGIFFDVNHISCINNHSERGWRKDQWHLINTCPFPHAAPERGRMRIVRRVEEECP